MLKEGQLEQFRSINRKRKDCYLATKTENASEMVEVKAMRKKKGKTTWMNVVRKMVKTGHQNSTEAKEKILGRGKLTFIL